MWLALQQDTPVDVVVATGKTASIREFVRLAFAELGIEIEFENTAEAEIARVTNCHNSTFQLETGKIIVRVDPNYFRPTEVEHLCGDPSKAKKVLGWEPQYTLEELIHEMVTADLKGLLTNS